jgi:fatty acid desaturase
MTVFRYPEGIWWNVAGFTYAFGGYVGGVVMLTNRSPVVAGIGVILVAHTLSVLSYFLHELAHGTIFATPRGNVLVGSLITWFNGSCYTGFATVRDLHLKHHAHRADVVRFDFKSYLREASWALRAFVLALEWLHVPAVEFVMRAHAFWAGVGAAADRRLRRRNLALLASRIAYFSFLAAVSLRALALYAIAYVLFVCFMRFFDAHQHTYQAHFARPDGSFAEIPPHDRAFEMRNTYSNLLAQGHGRWFNLLALNFTYHNAHHTRPAAAWYQLPRLHRDLFGDHDDQVITVAELIGSYHRHRIARVVQDDYGIVSEGAAKAAAFVGAVGVSFLY